MESMSSGLFWRSVELPYVQYRRANDCRACYRQHSHQTLSIGAVDGGSTVLSQGRCRSRLAAGEEPA
jgi:hypothetical protein